jgi:poly(A) polymerase
MTMDAFQALRDAGIPHYFTYISALDRYFRTGFSPNVYIYTPASLVDLAKVLPELRYPHLDRWDIAVDENDRTIYIRCGDAAAPTGSASFTAFNIYYDPVTDTFYDPTDSYSDLRQPAAQATRRAPPLRTLIEGAVLLARYPFHDVHMHLSEPPKREELLPEEQRMILTDILTGSSPWEGLQLLLEEGFIDAYWPDLSSMDSVDHTKDHHPEGNVWTHSLETLKYRKTRDLTLTLGLLFHDVGKPMAIPTRDRVFDKHANIGADIARSFLRKLEFDAAVVDDVGWLVWNHMFPGALHRLPVNRTESLMASELFPLLLELYRCDLSSSYRGPDGYYRACKIYRSFLKHRANPFRANDGKKLVKLYVE